jgi:hypothetical protein
VDDPVLATNLVSAGRRRLEKHQSEEAARAAIEAALRRAFPRD